MGYSNAISREAPQALEKLEEKLEKCERHQDFMKEINAYYRKHGTCKGFKDLSDEQAEKIDVTVEKAYSWDKQPYPSYHLSGNSAEIRRIKQRIKELSIDQETGFSGWTFEGGEAVVNDDLCRLQLVFDEKPSEEVIGKLKSNGFHWSPKEGAWQRQLNRNAISAANWLPFLKPTDGRSVSEHQPKVGGRSDTERDER